MQTFRMVDRGWRWRAVALAMLVASTTFASWIAPARRSAIRTDEVPFPTLCLGAFNKKPVDQAQFDQLYSAHLLFIERIGGRNPAKKNDPYAPLEVFELDEGPVTPGLADPLPPSNKGRAHPVKESGRLDLCGAHLSDLDLRGRDLRYARFMGARLVRVKLDGAKLDDSWWTYAGWSSVEADRVSARWADLTHLIVADDSRLTGMNGYGAIAPFASFQGGSLEGASFEGADLSSTKFSNVTMRDVDFSSSEASGVIYEPRLGHPPRIPTFRTTKGLDSLTTLNDGGAALTELQKSLFDAGLRGEAAMVRQALTEAPRAAAYRFQQAMQKIAFGAPYAYGRVPERLLVIGALLVPLFAAIYLVALLSNCDDAGIWIRREPIDKPEYRKIPTVRLSRRNSNVYWMALLFSLRMAFRIGWKDFNVGDWLARVQRNNYSLDAKGWPRSVAGIQSLVTLYLLALAVLSYFT